MGTLLWILVAIVLGVTPAMAEPPSMMTIVKQMKAVFEPSSPSTSKVIISSTSKVPGSERKETIQFLCGQARKMFPDGKRILLVMLEP